MIIITIYYYLLLLILIIHHMTMLSFFTSHPAALRILRQIQRPTSRPSLRRHLNGRAAQELGPVRAHIGRGQGGAQQSQAGEERHDFLYKTVPAT